ncbi:class I SAM-dependent methyltransferase [Nitrosomonas sp. Is37]|uniref:class I SAM-dependent methyltransferase n=1 Tax=Nitrosomonas sp. Is37 TaxID=3080535 RepID=UPI00294AAB73|nr:class I SAM-dependent methyltransferase [Nitrosomonas sp. Is37]MDV6345002.1 class I SAM-dependent methyltransferase [Nitrosomonas sp. Is37]
MRVKPSTITNLAKIATSSIYQRKEDETASSQIYDQIAAGYDNDYGRIFKRVKYEIEIQFSQLSLSSPSIVDVGTGTGENILLAKNFFGSLDEVYGIDISRKMLEIAKEKYPPMQTVQASALSMSNFIHHKVDLVFIHFLLSYVSIDKLLPLVSQLLKPDGYISIASSLLSSWPKGQKLGMSLGLSPGSAKHYIPKSSEELRSKLTDLGFKEADSIEIRKRMIFDSIDDVYRFGFEQGWVYQLFELLDCAGNPEKFAKDWGHIIPYDDEIHIHIGLYKKSRARKGTEDLLQL